jgi:signal transduction histidine kinase
MNPEVLIIGGAAVFSVLVFFIIIFIVMYQKRYYRFLREKQQLQNSFQNEILKTQLETQENTFFQIGEEIHDNIGQLLSSTKMFLGVVEQSLPSISDPLKKAQETLSKAIFEIRALSKSLNREWLNQFNLIQNLETEIDRINAANSFRIELYTSIRLLPLTPEAQVMLFRIIQEAVHNCLKHANARIIRIIINLDDMIRITVADDGKGFQTENRDLHGVGIINMRNRTRLLGGTIEWTSRDIGGTEVQILLPVQNLDYEISG